MKKVLCFILIYVMLSSTHMAFAMSTSTFDKGMAKGISYFNRGMYYEAKDEFQWFCDYNWGDMNYGQQQYALDYLDGTKARIQQLENRNTYTPSKGSSLSYYYPTYRNSYVPSYEAITGHKNYTVGVITGDGHGLTYCHQYMTSFNKEKMKEGINKYINALINMGYSNKHTSFGNIIGFRNKIVGEHRTYIYEKGIYRVKICVDDYDANSGVTWSKVEVYAYQ